MNKNINPRLLLIPILMSWLLLVVAFSFIWYRIHLTKYMLAGGLVTDFTPFDDLLAWTLNYYVPAALLTLAFGGSVAYKRKLLGRYICLAVLPFVGASGLLVYVSHWMFVSGYCMLFADVVWWY